MNMVVHRARHPELYEYIHSAVNGLLPFIQKVGVFFFFFFLGKAIFVLGGVLLDFLEAIYIFSITN